jgi:hypothetical protein
VTNLDHLDAVFAEARARSLGIVWGQPVYSATRNRIGTRLGFVGDLPAIVVPLESSRAQVGAMFDRLIAARDADRGAALLERMALERAAIARRSDHDPGDEDDARGAA